MYSVSLYQQKTSELDQVTGRIMWNTSTVLRAEASRPGGVQHAERSPFLLQTPCSWGAVFFPEHWREFHCYLIIRESDAPVPLTFKVVFPKVVSNGWKGSWKRFLIELVYLRGYTALYPNYPDFISLSTNHVALGTHIDSVKQAAQREIQRVPLIMSDNILCLPGGKIT